MGRAVEFVNALTVDGYGSAAPGKLTSPEDHSLSYQLRDGATSPSRRYETGALNGGAGRVVELAVPGLKQAQ